jgi:hypothetical protein
MLALSFRAAAGIFLIVFGLKNHEGAGLPHLLTRTSKELIIFNGLGLPWDDAKMAVYCCPH